MNIGIEFFFKFGFGSVKCKLQANWAYETKNIILLLILYLILHPEIVIIYIIILSKFINYFNGLLKHCSLSFLYQWSLSKVVFFKSLSFIYQDSNHMGQEGDHSSNFPIYCKNLYLVSLIDYCSFLTFSLTCQCIQCLCT